MHNKSGDSAEYWQHSQYERYKDFCRFEEATDISERLSLPVETVIPFKLRDGYVYSEFGDRFADVIWRGYEAAKTMAGLQPENAFEAERAGLEYDEALMVEMLARGELNGNMMMVESPVPDAVRAGTSSMGGYNRQRLRTMVRLYRADKDKLTCTTISLDQSHYQGLQAVAAAFGGEITDGQSSEDILAQRFVFNATLAEAEWLPALVRSSYDAVLQHQLGGIWYSGSRFVSQQDALSFVQAQPDLMEQHMRAIDAIMAAKLQPEEHKPRVEQLRQRLAAAVDARLHGHSVGSLSDDTVSAHQASGDFSGDCPTSSGSTAQALEAMGMHSGDKMKCVKCPLPGCGKTVDAEVTKDGIYCPGCERELLSDGSIVDHSQSEARSMGIVAMVELVLAEGRQRRLEKQAQQAAAKLRRAKSLDDSKPPAR